MLDKFKVGTRVFVLDLEGNDLGSGTYEGLVSFDNHGDETEAPPNPGPLDATPKIRLDTGKIIYGFDCYWTEADPDLKKSLKKLNDTIEKQYQEKHRKTGEKKCMTVNQMTF